MKKSMKKSSEEHFGGILTILQPKEIEMSFDGQHMMKYKDFCGYHIESHRFLHREECDDLFTPDDIFIDSEVCADSQIIDSDYYYEND